MLGPNPVRESLHGQSFDVAVIGGGINGVAVARECARGGKRTLLVEQSDFGSGATSRATRIIHGGLRYLEHGELGLVRESLRERERLLRQSPHLVRPMHFLLALRPEARRSALKVRAGLWLYRGMSALYHCPAPPDHSEVSRLERLLDAGARLNIFHYEDARCEFPELLVAEWLCEAIYAGAVARNHTEVLEVESAGGRVRGLRLRDAFTGLESRVESRCIINAAGPWVDRVCSRASFTGKRLIGGVRGSHLVLPRVPGGPQSAVYAEAVDGRPIFLVPWNGQLLLGTTEVRDEGDPQRVHASPQEVAYLLASAQRLFPGAGFRWSDIRCAFAGVRPLPFQPEKPAEAVTRRHRLHDHSDDGAAGLVSVIGGKLTTASSLARDCARRIGLQPREDSLYALGRMDDLEPRLGEWARHVAAAAGISEPSAHALAEWHGRAAASIAGLARQDEALRQPLCDHTAHLAAEAVAAARWRCAQTLADILLRRVPVALGACWSAECSRAAARRVGLALGWNERRTAQELEAFEAERQAFLQPPAEVAWEQRTA